MVGENADCSGRLPSTVRLRSQTNAAGSDADRRLKEVVNELQDTLGRAGDLLRTLKDVAPPPPEVDDRAAEEVERLQKDLDTAEVDLTDGRYIEDTVLYEDGAVGALLRRVDPFANKLILTYEELRADGSTAIAVEFPGFYLPNMPLAS